MRSAFPVIVPVPRIPRLRREVALVTLRTVVGGDGKVSLFLIATSPLSMVVWWMFLNAASRRLTLLLVSVASILAPRRAQIDVIRLKVFCILTWWGAIEW